MSTRTLPRHALTGVPAVGWRKARTGEAPGELYPIWPIRGGAEDDDPDDDTDDDPDDNPGNGDGDPDDDQDPEGADQLGDAGKKALDAQKAKWKAERDKRKQLEQELAAEREKNAGGDGTADTDRIKADAAREATAKANARIVRSEVRAAAAGKLTNPRDALAFLDLTHFEVDEDGQVDEDEIADAIDALLTERPYLAATAKQPRFQGTGDGGARKGTGGPKQLTEQDVKKMTPEQIDKAHRNGQLRDYLGG